MSHHAIELDYNECAVIVARAYGNTVQVLVTNAGHPDGVIVNVIVNGDHVRTSGYAVDGTGEMDDPDERR